MPTNTTKKSRSSKTTQQKSSNKSHFQSITVILLVVLTLSSIASWWFISYLWSVQKSEGNIKVASLILQALDGLSTPAPIDAQTGKIYFPQVRLVLPMATDTVLSEIEYRYSPPEVSAPEELRIVNVHGLQSARSAMVGAQNMEDTFEQVPKLQACTRGYQVSFAPVTDTQDPLIFTKQLLNGQNVYVYQDAGCNQSNEYFENYLKQIDSY